MDGIPNGSSVALWSSHDSPFEVYFRHYSKSSSARGSPLSASYVSKVSEFQNFRVVKDVQAWSGLSGFNRGYLKSDAQRTSNMRTCLEICRRDKNRTYWMARSVDCRRNLSSTGAFASKRKARVALEERAAA